MNTDEGAPQELLETGVYPPVIFNDNSTESPEVVPAEQRESSRCLAMPQLSHLRAQYLQQGFVSAPTSHIASKGSEDDEEHATYPELRGTALSRGLRSSLEPEDQYVDGIYIGHLRQIFAYNPPLPSLNDAALPTHTPRPSRNDSTSSLRANTIADAQGFGMDARRHLTIQNASEIAVTNVRMSDVKGNGCQKQN